MGWKAELKFVGVVEVSGEVSRVEIFPEFCEGLKSLEEFSHAIILYWFHLRDNEAERSVLKVVPKRHPGAPQVGVFACRSPSRPNPIGLCAVELVKVEGCNLIVKGLDAVEGSPIIDVKPYLPRADSIPDARTPEWAARGPET
ncbi:TPA: tRNA (N6-threonylcarbamoyladenosine(37)-N6)-methyltransferase TrmO [Candidatus Bathyarchaeota archaeon]|nr:tRNA (N6-threonylcarbamoyladenosine(37)-N6)-methyltransferase TrmO [Candidatus Bathyarchaeota archaeon]